MMKSLIRVVAAYFAVLASTANAHYLWVATDSKSGAHGTAHVYFEEGPAPGDGQYLDPFVKHGTTWIRTVKNAKPKLLEMSVTEQPGKRWLSAPLDAAAPRSIDSYGKFGVYRYGHTDVLLHYYARCLEVDDHDDLHELARAEQLELDIVPHDAAGALEITVIWRGKPATGRQVLVRGPKGFKQTLTTNDAGKASFRPESAGNYLLRTHVEENQGGKEGDKEYQSIRHHCTLSMKLPLGR